MDYTITKAMSPSHFGIIWDETKLTDLDFAGDLALLTNKYEQMQFITDSLKNLSKKVGLRIGVDKTKIQKIGNLDILLIYSLKEPHWKQWKTLLTWEAFSRMFVILKMMSKVELEKPVQFSDNFKLFEDPK